METESTGGVGSLDIPSFIFEDKYNKIDSNEHKSEDTKICFTNLDNCYDVNFYLKFNN